MQSTPLIKDTLVPAPLSFIEWVSFIGGFWSSESEFSYYVSVGTSEANKYRIVTFSLNSSLIDQHCNSSFNAGAKSTGRAIVMSKADPLSLSH